MIFLRPMRSESQPKKMKNGVPRSERDRDEDVRGLPIDLQRVCRKNSA